eukprot:5761291-Pyramimonas_sp.AAC.1
MTAHVDDLQITGCKSMRTWIKGALTRRAGDMKLQQIPYTHAGIQTERLNQDCLRLHQYDICSKLTIYKIPEHRLKEPESLCDRSEITIFRSLCCSALWACQTRWRSCVQLPVYKYFYRHRR